MLKVVHALVMERLKPKRCFEAQYRCNTGNNANNWSAPPHCCIPVQLEGHE